MKKVDLKSEFFMNTGEFLNRCFDKNNVPTQILEMSGGSCQCVACQNTGCNR
jgi:hypothetical protein